MGETDCGGSKLGLFLMGRAMLSKSLIQFSVEKRGCVPSLLFDLRPNYGGGNEVNGSLLPKVPCMHCYTQRPQPCSRPPPTHASARDSWTLTGKSGSVFFGVTFVCALQECVSLDLCKFCGQIPPVSKDKFSGSSQSLYEIPRLGTLLWVLELS